MRRLTRFDVQRAAFEGGVVFAVLTIVCAFCFSPLMELVGQNRAAITTAKVESAVVIVVLTTAITFVSGLATRWFGMGYKVTGSTGEEVSSLQPDLSAAARTASKMEDQGIEGVRIFAPSGTEVSRIEWEAAWWRWSKRRQG